MAKRNATEAPANRLPGLRPAKDYRRLHRHLERVPPTYRRSLGVQRTDVSAAAAALQPAGLIRYRRGIVTILDRRGLGARACQCYGVSRRGFSRLLGDPPRREAEPRKVRSGRA